MKKRYFPLFLCIFEKINFKIANEKKRGKWVVLRENERLLKGKLKF